MISRLLATAAASALLFATPLSAVAVRPRAGPVNDWVTVDADGQPHTIIPSVTTINGALTTISPPPYSLTGSVYTLTSTDGQKTTSTGRAPPPRATNSQGAGVFAVCNNAVGEDGPFCQPRRGSELRSRRTYYVTWDATFWGQDNPEVQLKWFAISPTTGLNTSNSPELTTGTMPGKKGFYVWNIDDKILHGKTFANISIQIVYPDHESREERTLQGPKVSILVAEADPPPESSGPNKLAIALPVVFGVLAIAAVGAFFWYRRRGGKRLSGISIKRSSSGYGVRKAHSERVGAAQKGAVNIQLGERQSPTSPSTPGRNVFQEELERQERERQ